MSECTGYPKYDFCNSCLSESFAQNISYTLAFVSCHIAVPRFILSENRPTARSSKICQNYKNQFSFDDQLVLIHTPNIPVA